MSALRPPAFLHNELFSSSDALLCPSDCGYGCFYCRFSGGLLPVKQRKHSRYAKQALSFSVWSLFLGNDGGFLFFPPACRVPSSGLKSSQLDVQLGAAEATEESRAHSEEPECLLLEFSAVLPVRPTHREEPQGRSGVFSFKKTC